MSKILITLFLSLYFITAQCQIGTSKIALGITPFLKAPTIQDAHKGQIEAIVLEEAVSIKDLNALSRSPEVLQKIAQEKVIQTNEDWMNSEVLTEVGRQLGATHILTGSVTSISVERKFLRRGPFNIDIYANFVNVTVSLSIINVTSGQAEASQLITSGILPASPGVGPDKAITNTIKGMSKKFKEFIADWHSQKKS